MNREDSIRQALLEPTIGKRMKRLRKVAGMKADDVVRQVPGLHRMTLSRIENDRQERSGHYPALAALYGVTEEDVLRPDHRTLMADASLGERIAARRKALNYSREELALAIGDGCSYAAIYAIEARGKGSRHVPHILSYLGMDVREEATNASALLREIRTQLLMPSEEWCRIADCAAEALDRAEDGDAMTAAGLIIGFCHGLVEGRRQSMEILPATVTMLDAEGHFETDGAHTPTLIRINGSIARVHPDQPPAKGDLAVLVTLESGKYVGRAGTLVESGRKTGIRYGKDPMHVIQDDDVVHLMRVG